MDFNPKNRGKQSGVTRRRSRKHCLLVPELSSLVRLITDVLNPEEEGDLLFALLLFVASVLCKNMKDR